MEMEKDLIGLCLKRDIVSKYGLILIPEKTVIREEHVQKLLNHNINLSEIESLQEITSKQFISEATKQIKEVFQFVRTSDRIPLSDVRKDIIPSIQEASKNPNLFKLLSELQMNDDYTYRHTIGVGVIATLIGKWLKLSETDLTLLTIGATLHDIGKMKVPLEILNKPGKLTEEEYSIIKKHTIYGYELIKNTAGASHRISLIALQHHEREDGNGYPFGLKGDKLDLLSKIVGVADVFHAMSSKRVYHEATPFYQVMHEMQRDVFGKLDPRIIFVFVQKILGTLVGNQVILTDGRKGKIIMIQSDNPANPLVQVEDQIIDLSKFPEINLEQVIHPS
jgi:putative nucleotidyltransferase with HDIG domain